MDLTATETSAFTGLSIRTVNAILRIRQRFAQACERESSDLLMGPAVFNPLLRLKIHKEKSQICS
jgi:hypothetical protein